MDSQEPAGIAVTDKGKISVTPLMFDQMRYEHMVTRYEERIYLLRRTLEGLATNSTQCGMCQMHVTICREAVERDDALRGDPAKTG